MYLIFNIILIYVFNRFGVETKNNIDIKDQLSLVLLTRI